MGKIWTCTICGKKAEWDDSWSWYGSILHEETCPNDIPVACSEKCIREIEINLNSGRFKLPTLRNRGPYCDVSTPKAGY
jgi:hypothetical protein